MTAIITAGTDRERLESVLAELAAEGVAYCFSMRGNTGVIEDRYNDYLRAAEIAGTDRWVGEHVGHVDSGGAYWGADGRLWARTRSGQNVLWQNLRWSFNHEHLDLPVLLVRLFTAAGFDADWSGDPFECVAVAL